MSTWGEQAEPLSEEERRDFTRLMRKTSSKMSDTELRTYTDLSLRETMVKSKEFRQWLAEVPEIARCLETDGDDLDQAVTFVQSLAQFDPNQKLSHHPSQKELENATALLFNKMVSLSPIAIRSEAVYTRLCNVLDVAEDLWNGMTVRDSEWRARGEFLGFEIVRTLRILRSKARTLNHVVTKLHELLRDAHSIQSRLITIREQELKLGE